MSRAERLDEGDVSGAEETELPELSGAEVEAREPWLDAHGRAVSRGAREVRRAGTDERDVSRGGADERAVSRPAGAAAGAGEPPGEGSEGTFNEGSGGAEEPRAQGV